MIDSSMVIMTGAQMPLTGFKAGVSRKARGMHTSVRGWSAKAVAFWATGDEEILRDLGADWLYVVPKWLSAEAATGIARSKAVMEAFRSKKDGERIVYRVYRELMPPRPEISGKDLEGLAVASVAGLNSGRLEEFRMLPVWLRNGGNRPIQRRAYIFYRTYDRTVRASYDERDAVGTVYMVDLSPGKEVPLKIPFVFPYNEGDYEVTFYVRAREGDVNLGSFRFSIWGNPKG